MHAAFFWPRVQWSSHWINSTNDYRRTVQHLLSLRMHEQCVAPSCVVWSDPSKLHALHYITRTNIGYFLHILAVYQHWKVIHMYLAHGAISTADIRRSSRSVVHTLHIQSKHVRDSYVADRGYGCRDWRHLCRTILLHWLPLA